MDGKGLKKDLKSKYRAKNIEAQNMKKGYCPKCGHHCSVNKKCKSCGLRVSEKDIIYELEELENFTIENNNPDNEFLLNLDQKQSIEKKINININLNFWKPKSFCEEYNNQGFSSKRKEGLAQHINILFKHIIELLKT